MREFKIQVNFRGHLRGVSHLNDLKKFFNSLDIQMIKEELKLKYDFDFNYKQINIEYNLYTYPEIYFKNKILKYGFQFFPELYKKYTLDDFNIWLKEFNKIFNFNKIFTVDPLILKNQTDIEYENILKDIEYQNNINIINNIKNWCGYQFTKYENYMDIIKDDFDLIFQTRPDIIFNYDFNQRDVKLQINKTFAEIIFNKDNTIFTNFISSDKGCLRSGDYFHISSSENIKIMYNNIHKNNLKAIKEYDKLLKKSEEFPFLIKLLQDFVHTPDPEKKQLINIILNNTNNNKYIEIKSTYIPNTLLYIYVPYKYNYNGEINYHTIHDKFKKPINIINE